MSATVILCETPEGCTCGAPASTPRGMHHCDCAVHPGWCGRVGCMPCEQNGKLRPTVPAKPPRPVVTRDLLAARAAAETRGEGERDGDLR